MMKYGIRVTIAIKDEVIKSFWYQGEDGLPLQFDTHEKAQYYIDKGLVPLYIHLQPEEVKSEKTQSVEVLEYTG